MDCTVRVELKGYATEADYEKLHQEMARRGFSRTLKGNGNRTYAFPPAEYYAVNVDSAKGCQIGREAATATGKAHEVVATSGTTTFFLPTK